MNENTARNRLRRDMAKACMVLIWVVVIAFLYGLSSDTLAARVEKVWPPFAVIFPSLMGYIGWYVKLGSDENKHAAELALEKEE